MTSPNLNIMLKESQEEQTAIYRKYIHIAYVHWFVLAKPLPLDAPKLTALFRNAAQSTPSLHRSQAKAPGAARSLVSVTLSQLASAFASCWKRPYMVRRQKESKGISPSEPRGSPEV